MTWKLVVPNSCVTLILRLRITDCWTDKPCCVQSVLMTATDRRWRTLGRSFAYAGPSNWNSPPAHLRDNSLSFSSFKRHLKTFLFSFYWASTRSAFGVLLQKTRYIIKSLLLLIYRRLDGTGHGVNDRLLLAHHIEPLVDCVFITSPIFVGRCCEAHSGQWSLSLTQSRRLQKAFGHLVEKAAIVIAQFEHYITLRM